MNRQIGRNLRIILIWTIVVLLAFIQFSSLIQVTKSTIDKNSNDDAMPILPSSISFPFSACLIIKDDNIILPEWLAYHYTVLPLRRLIVGVDLMSYTDPAPILHAFEDNTGMDVSIWKNDTWWSCVIVVVISSLELSAFKTSKEETHSLSSTREEIHSLTLLVSEKTLTKQFISVIYKLYIHKVA